MLKKLIIAVAIVALAIAGYQWLNAGKQGGQSGGRTPAAANERSQTASERSPRTAPTGEQTQAARGEGAAPNATEQGQQPPTTEAGSTPTGERTGQQRPSGGGRGMGMGTGSLGQQGATSVEVIRAEAADQSAQLRLFGQIDALQNTSLSATSSASVSELLVAEGETVQAGQIIARLDAPSTLEQLQQRQSALLELEARMRNDKLRHETDLAALEIEQELLRIAKNSVDRFSSLNEQQLSSSNDYETALRSYQSQLLSMQQRQLSIAQYEDTLKQLQAQRSTLQSQIRQSQQLVEELTIRAPFDGVLSRLNVKLGQQVRINDVIAEVYAPDSLALYVRVPMAYRFDQYPLSQLSAVDDQGQEWQAQSIRPVNESGAQRLMLAALDDIDSLPGSHVELTLSYPLGEASVFVPATALYDQQRVYTFNRGTIEPVEVTILGRRDGGYLLAADPFGRAPIITTRLKNPVTGMAVSVLNRPDGGGRGQ